MGLASTLARRSLLQRPARSIFSILGIAVGIATVVGVYTLDHNTIEGLKEAYYDVDQDPESTNWRPELEVSPSPGVTDPRGELNSIEGVAGAAEFFQNEILLRKPGQPDRDEKGRPQGVRARMMAVEAEMLPRLDAYELLAGARLNTESETPQVLVGSPIAEKMELAPGDEINLSRRRRAAPRVCIDGQMQRKQGARVDEPTVVTFEVAGVLTREKLGRRANGDIVLVDLKWGEVLFQDAHTNRRYWVRPDPVANIEDLQQRLSNSFAYDVGLSVVVGQAADERAYRNGVYMAGLLALMLGLYVIFHTMSMSLVERVREIGVLHALGAGRRQIAKIFLLEAVVLSGIGGLLGLGGGIALAAILLENGISTLGTGKYLPNFGVPWGVFPLAALGVGTALLGSIFPLLRARNASVVEALRGEKAMDGRRASRGFHFFTALLIAILLPAVYFRIVPVVGAASGALIGSILLAVAVLGLLLAVPLLVPGVITGFCRLLASPFARLFPFAGSMAVQTMQANPRRIAVSTAAISLVCAAFVGLKGMTASLRGEIDDWAENSIEHKVWIRHLEDVELDALSAALHELPEVLGVEQGSVRTYSPFLFIGLRAQELLAYGPLSRQPELQAVFEEQQGIIISERVARNLAYVVGDEIPVRIGSGEVVPFQIIAISDEYGYFPHPDERMYGVVSDRYMKQYFCLDIDHPEYVGVRLTPDADPGIVEARTLEFMNGEGEPRFLTGEGLRQIQIADIRADFALFDLILALTALLAALGVLNGQLLSALERSKELGVLRALGADSRQISGMVWLESGVMGFFGGALGVLLGSLLGPVIIRSLETLSGLELPVRGAGWWTGITLAAAVLLTLAAGAYPVRRMNRTDTVRAIRTGG